MGSPTGLVSGTLAGRLLSHLRTKHALLTLLFPQKQAVALMDVSLLSIPVYGLGIYREYLRSSRDLLVPFRQRTNDCHSMQHMKGTERSLVRLLQEGTMVTSKLQLAQPSNRQKCASTDSTERGERRNFHLLSRLSVLSWGHELFRVLPLHRNIISSLLPCLCV